MTSSGVKQTPCRILEGADLQTHETLIWCGKNSSAKGYTFNYDSMKSLNEGLQMRSDWLLPLCTGAERLKGTPESPPNTEAESLISRVILSTSKPGDLIVDPFSGSGTTAAVAKRFSRRFIGIEQSKEYVEISRQRLQTVQVLNDPDVLEIETKGCPESAIWKSSRSRPGKSR